MSIYSTTHFVCRSVGNSMKHRNKELYKVVLLLIYKPLNINHLFDRRSVLNITDNNIDGQTNKVIKKAIFFVAIKRERERGRVVMGKIL